MYYELQGFDGDIFKPNAQNVLVFAFPKTASRHCSGSGENGLSLRSPCYSTVNQADNKFLAFVFSRARRRNRPTLASP
ncbi:unnamed protein product [Protopolystoma xenopodis]|uniref:Uncharacterized protein n=1 Tax=Protopolystoma xenopodis TaxID=117903 RepID=A0A3S5B3D1_9PLAT|nr:unnamed protein product [Protopolystoma xenopodis]